MKTLKIATFSVVVVVGLALQLVPLGARRQSPQGAIPAGSTIGSGQQGAVVPLSLDETVRKADAIVVGTITRQQSRWGDTSKRWIVTDYFMAVEDLIYRSEKADPIGASLVLTYWGGTIGDETHAISDVRLPIVGERLLVMLRPDWGGTVGTPVVGFNYGLFSIAPDVTGGTPLVRDAAGQHLALAASGHVVRRAVGLTDAPSVSLAAFVDWLRANIASIKAARSEPLPAVDPNDPRVMKTFAKTPLVGPPPSSGITVSQGLRKAVLEPGIGGNPGGVPEPAWAPTVGASISEIDIPSLGGQTSPSFAQKPAGAVLPIVVNSFPPTFTSWYPEDQYQMSKWNYYASGVFEVYTTPSGTFGWPDGRFDLDGWPTSTQLQTVYNTTWEALGGNTIGITFSRYAVLPGNLYVIAEADIALNPAFSFTLDDEWAWDDPFAAVTFRQTMVHELGHMHGLDHDFTKLGIMNYLPMIYRSFGLPFMDDAAGVRAEFPSKVVSRTDLGVYLYRASGYQSVANATYPASVTVGQNLTVSNFLVENVGTTTIATPTVEWYLTSARNYNSSYYYLGQWTSASLLPATSTSAVQATFAVPSNVTPGYYYLAGFIRSDGGASQASFPFSNNYAFSRTTIRVFPTPPASFNKSAPANAATGQSTRPTLTWGASTGAAVYEYCLDATNDNACSGWIGVGPNTSVGVGGLSANTPYYWQVRATNTGGTTYANGLYTAFWSFTPTATPPDAFGKISPANGATGQSPSPTLSWGISSGLASYEYCYDTINNNACDASWVPVGSATSATLIGLSVNTPYYWQVRAIDDGGTTYANGAVSAFWSFTTRVGGGDSYEPDDTSAQASLLAPGTKQAHTFHANADTDWARVAVVSGQNYTVYTSGLQADVDTVLYLYGPDGVTELDYNDDDIFGVGRGSRIAFTATATGFYYLKVIQFDPSAGLGGYALALTGAPFVDLNGDTNGDVLTYKTSTGQWARQLGLAGGGFTESVGAWAPGWSVVPAHFNADALTDFFLFNTTTGQWSKMLNDGVGFTPQSSGGWWSGWERYVMDLDGDGISDFFLYDPATGVWFKCFSTPTGFNYVQGGWNPGWEIYPMRLNADAYGDMFLINRVTGRWFWVLGENGPGFTYPVTETWFPGWQFYPGDFNGDGLTDLLLHDPPTGTYFVAQANASGFTYRQGGWSLGWTPYVGDLDADGKDDLFLHAPATGVWFQMMSDGAGNFTNVGGQTWSLGWKVYLTDVNADGRADIVLYDPATGAWYQARNLVNGTFAYSSGTWSPGLVIVTRTPIR